MDFERTLWRAAFLPGGGHFTTPFRHRLGNGRAHIGETLSSQPLEKRSSYTLFWNRQRFIERALQKESWKKLKRTMTTVEKSSRAVSETCCSDKRRQLPGAVFCHFSRHELGSPFEELGKFVRGSGTLADDPGKFPNGSGSLPDDPGKFPNGSESLPDDPEKFPNCSESLPDDPEKFPNDSGSFPQRLGKLPNGSGRFPNGSGSFPNGSGSLPNDPGSLPNDPGSFSEVSGKSAGTL